jgi:4,4'-diaponeurosporenoate glycosyltransferase
MTFDLIIICAGLLVSLLLFYRFPVLSSGDHKVHPLKLPDDPEDYPVRITVIIPARNEEINLPLLLTDLRNQTDSVFEIICVDDDSDDSTAQMTAPFGIKLISLREKPKNWIGKSFACQTGADAARGDVFLFLDADVRLAPDSIRRLKSAYRNNGHVISVQPFHKMVKGYEQFSLFFNLIQFAANGLGLPVKNRNIGLFGPVILISRKDYFDAGGHASIHNSIIDDVALGQKLKDKKIAFDLFIGDRDISFRMYGGGIKDLLDGWTKNQASGAMKTPVIRFLIVFLWITSCASAPLQIIRSIYLANYIWAAVFFLFFILWMLELRRISTHIGTFKRYVIVLYPVYLVMFCGVFFVSIFKKVFHLKVIWKDREITLGK